MQRTSGPLLLPFWLALLLSGTFTVSAEDTLLKCDEFERHFDITASDVYCTVSGFMVSHSQNVKIQEYTKANTKFMKFYDSRLLYIPFKLFDVFGGLKSLDVSNTDILDVPRNTFGSAGNLTSLTMNNNNITQISTSAFMGASNLMRLDLSHNQISELNEFAFRGLGNLDKLQLSYNQIKFLHKDIFLKNEYIGSIALDNNLIEYIEPEVFNHLLRIRDVNLKNNNIRRIHPQTFKAAYGLEILLLSSNQLDEFQLENKAILTQLQLDYNNLTRIAVNGTKFVNANHNRITEVEMINPLFLESLELSTNNISNISAIANLTGLLHLDLSHNPIGPLNVSTFDRLKRLRVLRLRAVGLQRLNFGMFSKQVNLEMLDLAFNNLTQLNIDMFVPYLSGLKTLLVDGNNLTEIQGKRSFTQAFPSLFTLGVSRNRFNCSYLHSLLVPPQLATSVTLHIEPEESAVEASHIRDITCISNVNTTLQVVTHELHDISRLQEIMNITMSTMHLHEQRLELYLLAMKITLIAMSLMLVVVSAMYVWKVKRSGYFRGHGASIVFRSSATVDSNILQP